MTRAAGLERLADFLANEGAEYAGSRNFDLGPERRSTTSTLSPYLRRRLITEAEVVAAAVAAFGDEGAERFVSEVFWRTYFKGHLETHPAAWTGYLALTAEGHERLATEPGLRRTYEAAIEGRTGIDCFDAWALELVETGWLHNHARMWFASIWIFTLRLPWALGAEFFMRHLVDGDPASNTLSWRWVAGLHTRGKHYVAGAENIRRYTDGRFDPVGLDEYPDALDEPMPPREMALPPAGGAEPEGEVALLLHLDDLHPESLPLGTARVARVGGFVAHADGASDLVKAADEAAMADALVRAEAYFGCPASLIEKDWAGSLPIVTAWAPVGPSAMVLPQGCLRLCRAWDEAAWPLATRGYSRLRKAIPRLSLG
ncbi:deoxyribodipyrimidine photolyase [Methylobacterium sp. W2]|uniref:FAD-binding domain-containing protein n=1 Tax=Methylobacterium sp. W2 TaxID=2598107 RepID=UPI001D0C8FF6|nr:FAD-binding domain-containing protein [Methylobacterium sp. W2]MCC0809035.1 deoxyribodipyrimidine photolyase [Methylobacterium sp. W2]